VSVDLREHHGGWRLTVADDGAGFDPAHAAAAGSGAGLANMRDRLDAVGGTLAITSVPGTGTTVTAVVRPGPGLPAGRPSPAAPGPVA
jgi:signal transduction histidine kinase